MRLLRAYSLAALLGTAMAATPVSSQDLTGDRAIGEIALSNDTVQLRFRDGGTNPILGKGTRASAAMFLSEERDVVFFGDILFPADLWADQFQLLFGPRMYAALLEEENNDIMALSLGAEARFALGGGLAVSAQAFYAPDILTFGTADSVADLSARLEFTLQPRLTVFAGMRWFEFELIEEIDGEDTRTLQEELFAGLAWQF